MRGRVSLAVMPAATVTDATFAAEVERSALPVLIDFWAPNCAPCRVMAPIVDQLADEYAGRLKVVKMDTAANTASPARWGVRGVPNLILVKEGRVAQQLLGAVTKTRLVRAIEDVLAG